MYREGRQVRGKMRREANEYKNTTTIFINFPSFFGLQIDQKMVLPTNRKKPFQAVTLLLAERVVPAVTRLEGTTTKVYSLGT